MSEPKRLRKEDLDEIARFASETRHELAQQHIRSLLSHIRSMEVAEDRSEILVLDWANDDSPVLAVHRVDIDDCWWWQVQWIWDRVGHLAVYEVREATVEDALSEARKALEEAINSRKGRKS